MSIYNKLTKISKKVTSATSSYSYDDVKDAYKKADEATLDAINSLFEASVGDSDMKSVILTQSKNLDNAIKNFEEVKAVFLLTVSEKLDAIYELFAGDDSKITPALNKVEDISKNILKDLDGKELRADFDKEAKKYK